MQGVNKFIIYILYTLLYLCAQALINLVWMNLDIGGTIIRITQESLKEENSVCKETCMSILIYRITQGFWMTYLSHLLIKQTLQILLNERITGFTPLKPKHHWDLLLKMVFRQNLLYFASLITFMDGLYLDNDFRTRFLRFLLFLLLFLLFSCWWGCFVGPVVVVSGLVSLFYYY